jgi:hypothetical protein
VIREQVESGARSALFRRARRDERARGVRPLVRRIDRTRDTLEETLDVADNPTEEAADEVALFWHRRRCGGAEPGVREEVAGEERGRTSWAS